MRIQSTPQDTFSLSTPARTPAPSPAGPVDQVQLGGAAPATGPGLPIRGAVPGVPAQTSGLGVPAQTSGLGAPAQPAGVSVEQAMRILEGETMRPEAVWTRTPPEGRFPCGPALGPAGLLVGSTRPMGGGRITVLDPATGAERWTREVKDEPEWLAQGLDGTVYDGQRFGIMEARDGATGEVRWKTEVGHHLSGPPVDLGDGRLYGLRGGRVAAFDAATGQQVWSVPNALGLREKGPVGTGDGGVVVHADNGLFCFEGSTGQMRWHRDDVVTLAAAKDGLLFAGAERALLALDPKTGETVRRVDLPAKPFAAPVPGPGERVYVPLRDSQLVAVDGDHISWNSVVYTDFSSFVTPIGQRLVLAGNSDMKTTFGLAADTGRRLWIEESASPVAGRPVVDGRGAIVANYQSLRRFDDELRLVGPPTTPPEEQPEIQVGEKDVQIGDIHLPRRS